MVWYSIVLTECFFCIHARPQVSAAACVGSRGEAVRPGGGARGGLLRPVPQDARDLLPALLGRRAVLPRWPENKPIYLMPNIEMVELTPEHYWRVDVVLCKTKVCYDRVTRWFEEEGNPRNAQVFYTKHTSSDQAQFARKRLADDSVAPKDFSDVRFIHTAGTSIWKGTKQLLDCWTSTPGLPPLDLYANEGSYNYLMQGPMTSGSGGTVGAL